MDGTRAVTLMVAFDAGARTERPEENGMAHFLEHLVFKGGEKYKTYRDVNEAAERNGAVLNAYTSHDLVAFHITARSTKGIEAADLLTDFVGRPRSTRSSSTRSAASWSRRSPATTTSPSAVAEHLIDEAVFGDHPLGRPVLGPAEHLAETFTRDGIIAFRNRQWAPTRGAALAVGNLDSLGRGLGARRVVRAIRERSTSPTPTSRPRLTSPRVLVTERDSNQSHLRMSYRPSIDVTRPGAARRPDDLLDAAGRLDGLAPVRRDP